MFFLSFCLKREICPFCLKRQRAYLSLSIYIIMCYSLFLSNKTKTCAFSSKKLGKSLEGIGKSCTFALAFQNYGKRLTLRATRKSSLRRLHTTESSTRSDSYTLLYIECLELGRRNEPFNFRIENRKTSINHRVL